MIFHQLIFEIYPTVATGTILEILLSGFHNNYKYIKADSGSSERRRAYSGTRSLKQEVWGTASLRSYRATFLKSKNDATVKFGSHIAT